MRRFDWMNFQIITTANSKLYYTPCYIQILIYLTYKNKKNESKM
jgi:hypothetical protein